ARFLQIPRHHGHPCVKLTATSAFAARDFHPIDYTHAGRTSKKNRAKKWVPGLLSYLLVSLKSFTVYPLKLQKIFYVYDSFTESIQPHFSLLFEKSRMNSQ
ncbi:hypothetical protein Q8A72_18090, partial [Aeribacillus pallidus]|nr:hypothetical protein [Aeribacillus pallidus]